MDIAEKLQVIAENEQKIYDAGYAKGKSEGGGGGGTLDPATKAVMKMINRPQMNVVSALRFPPGIFISGDTSMDGAVAIIPESVIAIEPGALDNIGSQYLNSYRNEVLCLPTNPPFVTGQISGWSSNGGGFIPKAIYVPDESVDAYKIATNWAEFAHVIKPMSEIV